MRAAVVFLCLIALACGTVEAATMPWKLFNEPSMLAENTMVKFVLCPAHDTVKEVLVAGFIHDEAVYVMAYDPESGRIAFVYSPPGQHMPTEIGLGRVDLETPGAHNVIPPLVWMPFVYEIHNSICGVLFAESA